jgi:hypothetical protein
MENQMKCHLRYASTGLALLPLVMTSESLNTIRALETGSHHVLTSQVEAESKRTGPQRETLQQFAASNLYLLVVDDDSGRYHRSPPDVPSTDFKYDRQVRVDHPVFDAQSVFHQSLNHLLNFHSTTQAESTEHA